MKRVLIIKTSSLGDVIHTLPALTDAAIAFPSIIFDWVVEQNFSEVPAWHPTVQKVIPSRIRFWRKHPFLAWKTGQWAAFKQRMGEYEYDAIIDAQGLLKSAWLTRYVTGVTYGLDKDSVRESIAAHFYQYPLKVAKGQMAVERTRQLFSQALGYTLPTEQGQYGLSFVRKPSNKIMLLHGTTWRSKHWPDSYWQQLAVMLAQAGYEVLLPWGNKQEQQRADKIALASKAKVLPKLTLTELAKTLSGVQACVAVDSGLGHLAAAVGTPTVALFGATNAALTGFYGENQFALQTRFDCSPCMQRECKYAEEPQNIHPPCFATLPPESIFEQLQILLAGEKV